MSNPVKPRRVILLSLLISLAAFTWVTWPLAVDVHGGMPSSHRPEAGGARYLIPGDHLQFWFHLWMFSDVVRGQTPLFGHVYEFNQGDDKARYERGTYYFPLGVLYAVGDAIGGRAVGWNGMLFFCAWMSYLTTWVLARRYCRSPVTAAVAALPGLLLPYFWACSLGGSPTGPGMLWVPVIFYGVDKAVRDRRVWGGLLAGAALFMSPWADLHVFFFGFLAAPVWMAFCFAAKAWLGDEASGYQGSGRQQVLTPDICHPEPRTLNPHSVVARPVTWWNRVFPVLPLTVLMGAAYLQTTLVKQSLSGTVQAAGRKAAEASNYAPTWDGWFAWSPDHRHNLIYLGIVVVAVLATGKVLLMWDLWRRRPGGGRRLLVYGLLLGAIVGIALLALGPNIPKDSTQAIWRTLRAFLPPYKMIRQPAKIFCVLAPFLSVALALALDRIAACFTRRSAATAVTLALGCLIAWDYGRRIEPTICLFDYEQGAYAAIAADAVRSGRENRAMSLPIWPGDSHWNSVTEYYATLHRTKMLNGYRPSVRKQYLEEIFERLAPMNMGYITDDRLDALLARRIGYLLIQEDAFPEKVSPFPVSHTLRALRQHPRLRFLARDHAIWAFRILGADEVPAVAPRVDLAPVTLLGGRRWRARDGVSNPGSLRQDGPQGESYVRLTNAVDCIRLPPRQLYRVDGLRYLVAARGAGTLQGVFDLGSSNVTATVAMPVNGDWTWVELPVPPFQGINDVVLTLSAAAGTVDVDMVTVMAGPWAWLEPGQSLTLPADAFFRAGYSEVADGSVYLEATRTPAAGVFYGPNLPVCPGRYRVTLDVASSAPAGTILGELVMSAPGQGDFARCPVTANHPMTLAFDYAGHRPLRLELDFTRNGDLAVRSVTLTRLP